ncbi:allene oxide cyclase barrel-like domain-containing protein [Streptomyces lavendulocolor]|uniref:allene oxide cyclase barrel-like domain-containing protein n=1 Tax=Streptomyces lavendulocolor TaxID=67316 RepID=UPI003C2B15F0
MSNTGPAPTTTAAPRRDRRGTRRRAALPVLAAASLAAVVAVVAVGGTAVGSANAGPARKGGVEILELEVRNDQYTAVDLGPEGPGLGDMDVYSGTAVKDGKAVGRGGGTCQVVHVKGAELTSQCQLTMEVAQGSVTLQSLWAKGAGPLDMAVTGGTGVYREARGTARFWDIGTPDERVRLEIRR